MFKDLIELYNLEECNLGKITVIDRFSDKYKYYDNRLGEILDVFNVLVDKKPLAALDLSYRGRIFLKTLDTILINKILYIVNKQIEKGNIVVLHNITDNQMYLKTIITKTRNIDNAKKLMYILWSIKSNTFNDIIKLQFWIGNLLGYKYENIKYFMYRNYRYILNDYDIHKFTNLLHKLKIKTLKNIIYLQKIHNI